MERSKLSSLLLPSVLMSFCPDFPFMFLQTMTTNKINERLEFPTELDMFPYTLEGLQRRERGARGAAAAAAAAGDGVRSSPLPAGAASSSSSSSSSATAAECAPLRAPEYYRYVLRGVVVHQGHVAGGHYYSYIQDRSAAPGSSSGWFEFNDKRVSAFDFARDVDEECYGGGKESSWSGSAKSRSAYILFYDRVRSDVVQINKQTEWKATMGAAAMAALFLVRIKSKYAQTRALLNPGGSSSDSSSTVQSNQLQVIHQQYAQQLQHLSDLMAFHPASSLTFHLELMRDCKLGLRFAVDSVWRRSGDPLAEVSVMHVASYAIKHFLHVFVRSYTHDKLMQPWMQLLLSIFVPRDERQLASFPFTHVLPLATWLIDYVCFVKPEQAKAAATAAAAAAQDPSAADQKDSGKVADSSSSSNSSALSARGKSVSQDDMPMHGPAPRGAASASSSKHQRSHSGDLMSWEDAGGADSDGDGDGFAHTLPPFDAPPSLLFGYLISCPESDVREGVSELVCAAATIMCKYQLATRERELAPSLCTLVDHLAACVPFLPFYASKSLALYLKLVHKLCSASQLILARFMAGGSGDGVNGAEGGGGDATAPQNDLLSRLIDLYLGGVLPDDNPCGNRINRMALSSARLRRYYPLTKEVVYSTASVWQRPFWLLINLLVTHSDLEPFRATPPVTATATNSASSSDSSSSSSAESASDLKDVELKEDEPPAAQSADVEVPSESAGAISAPPSAPVSRRHSADTSGDDVPDAPAIPLSANAVSLLRFPQLLRMMVSDSAVSARMLPIAELVRKLAEDNLPYSQSLTRVLFDHIENAGAVTASYTLLRLLLRIDDSVASARRFFILNQWLNLLGAEQMYWNPMDSSLNHLLTLLTARAGGQALVELMHAHVAQWRWLIDWLINNKTPPLPYSSSESGVQLDKLSRTGARGGGASSSTSLRDSWRSGTSWQSPSFNTDRLGSLRMAADDSGADSAAGLMGLSDDESTEVSTVEEYDEDEQEASRTRKIALRVAAGVSSGAASASGSATRSSNRPRSTFMKARVFKPHLKYLMLKRMERGLGPLDDAEDDAEAEAGAAGPAAAAGGAEWEREDGNPNSETVSAWFNNLPNTSSSLGLRHNAAEAVRRATAHQGDRGAGGSASGDEYDDNDSGSSPLSYPSTRPSSSSTGARPCTGVTFAVGATVDAWCVADEEGAPPSWQAATIVAIVDDKVKVHFQQHYFSAKDAWLPKIASRIAPRGSMTVAVSPHTHARTHTHKRSQKRNNDIVGDHSSHSSLL